MNNKLIITCSTCKHFEDNVNFKNEGRIGCDANCDKWDACNSGYLSDMDFPVIKYINDIEFKSIYKGNVYRLWEPLNPVVPKLPDELFEL